MFPPRRRLSVAEVLCFTGPTITSHILLVFVAVKGVAKTHLELPLVLESIFFIKAWVSLTFCPLIVQMTEKQMSRSDELLTELYKLHKESGLGGEWKMVDAVFSFLRRKTPLLKSDAGVKRVASLMDRHVQAIKAKKAKR